jgi:predicted phosphodiesterase
MAKFLYWSDLHTEFADFDLPDITEKIDAVLLGGDTAVGRNHLNFLFKVWEKYAVPVISIRGNHEYYSQIWEELREQDAIRLDKWKDSGIPIHLLDKDTIIINGTRIIGTTLWTDMLVMGDHGVFAVKKVENSLNDYKTISMKEPLTGRVRTLKAQDTMIEHMLDKDYIFKELAKPFKGPTIVMTHHVPTERCIHPMYANDMITAGFASNLTEQMEKSSADIWLYGHTHQKSDTTLTREDGKPLHVMSNIRGYPHEMRTSQFVPKFILKT